MKHSYPGESLSYKKRKKRDKYDSSHAYSEVTAELNQPEIYDSKE